ncbi:MAG: hypothetical protein OXE95_07935 [Chloroflexi bacterium]|nr:hypothetical protein [Chloroflexota bacterium]
MPGLKLDFSKTDRKWQRQWVATITAKGELESVIDTAELDAALDEELGISMDAALVSELDRERRKLAMLDELLDGMILDVLIEAPVDILNASAPKEIDWSKRESLDYIRGDRWADFIVGISLQTNGNARANF